MAESRLTFVASTLAFGGAERVWSQLVPELARRGFGVRVLTLVEEGHFFHELRERGVRVECAHMRRRTDVAGLRRAFRVLEGGTDLVVSQSVNAQFVGMLMARRARVPHVTVDQAGPGLALRTHQRLLLRLVARSVDRLIAVSELQTERLVGLGFDRERMVVIPNGTPPMQPTVSREEARRRLGLAADDVGALLVADLRPVKNAPAFVEAVARAHAVEPRLRGFLAGDGPERDVAAAAAARAAGAVELLGARADVPDLMNAADVVCLTSRTEGKPLAVLEAMSAGRPVVATRVGGLVELVVDGETGMLVPEGDPAAFAAALVELARDEPRRASMGEAARMRHADLFSLDRMVDAYAETFSAVIAGRA